MYKRKRVIVITGGLNEEGKIGEVIRKIPSFVDKVVAIDDASSDNTAEEAKKAGALVLKNDTTMGAGYVLRRGFNYAVKYDYDIIVVVAGDNQDFPSEIKKLVKPLTEGYDLVLGSRYLKKHKVPVFKKIQTKVYSYLFSMITNKHITDASNGFRAFKTSLLKNIDVSASWLNGYELEPYFLLQAIKKGYKVKEVSVNKRYDHKKGYSKMRPFLDWWRICKPLFKK